MTAGTPTAPTSQRSCSACSISGTIGTVRCQPLFAAIPVFQPGQWLLLAMILIADEHRDGHQDECASGCEILPHTPSNLFRVVRSVASAAAQADRVG